VAYADVNNENGSWATEKGFVFSGHNGGAIWTGGMAQAYGQPTASGDVICVCVSRATRTSATQLSFAINGRDLGTAFVLSGSNDDLVPVVDMANPGDTVTLLDAIAETFTSN